MSHIRRAIRRFLKDDDGPTAVEYALMAVLILGVIITVVALLGQNTGTRMSSDAKKISAGR